MKNNRRDKTEQVKKTGNDTSKTLLAGVAGAFLAAFARDIVNELPLWIKIATISLICIIAIIITIKVKWENIKESRVIYVIYKNKIILISGIIGGIIGYILGSVSYDIYRIVFSLLSIINIFIWIISLYKTSGRTKLRSKIKRIAIIVYFSIFLLQLTYIENIISHALNTITRQFIGKPIVGTWLIYERSYLGLYKSLRSGYGKYVSSNGNVWEGFFIDGNLNGEGKIVFANGSVWEGTFVDDKLNGEGKMTFVSGLIIEGFFIDNNLNGEGKIVSADGSVWEGTFVDNKLNGIGKKISVNRNIREGYFIDGRLNGIGRLAFNDGYVVEGFFENDEIHGNAKIISPSGEVKSAIFVQGRMGVEDHSND